MYTLDERLLGLEHAKTDLFQHFLSPTLVPRYWNCSYLKADLIDRIKSFLKNQKVNLREREGNQDSQIGRIPWGSLKRVEYGRLNARGMHAEVFKRLTDFEAIYLLAGLWRKKSSKDRSKRFNRANLEQTPIKITLARLISEGVYFMSHVASSEEKTARMPYQRRIIERCKGVIVDSQPAKVQADFDDDYSLGVNPQDLPDIVSYLRNCDILKTRPYFGHFRDELYPLKV